MKIQLLSAELTNQIAAGEVVERPASVIKELLENSLDAGATEIKIDLRQGGSQLIRIQDNGFGIAKEDLALALTRHATSKIQSFDDLLMIMSLGFRGEALASIASISRLTLSSKPAAQAEAWSIYAQGREMTTELKPIAHPKGTTIEVLDLFYNTPARKRFLKSEKTELIHILETLKKIALSAPTVSFMVSHNGKLLHHYHRVDPTQKTPLEVQQRKWLTSICGTKFGKNSQAIAAQTTINAKKVDLKGWIYPSNEQVHYFYVNGRAIKDKVILHAIKKVMLDCVSFESVSDVSLNYVLFLTLDPLEVDVNVHPTKQEVRFHDSRSIHDFIYEAILNGLQTELAKLSFNDSLAKTEDSKPPAQKTAFLAPSPQKQLKEVNTAAYQKAYRHFHQAISHQISHPQTVNPQALKHPNFNSLASKQTEDNRTESDRLKSNPFIAPISVDSFMEENENQQQKAIDYSVRSQSIGDISQKTQFGRVCALVNNQFALLEKKAEHPSFFLLSLCELDKVLFQIEMNGFEMKTDKQTESLLAPIRFELNKKELKLLKQHQSLFFELGFSFDYSNQFMILNRVPISLRYTSWQQQWGFILAHLSSELTKTELTELLWCCHQVSNAEKNYTLSEVIQKIGQLEQARDPILKSVMTLNRLVQAVDLSVLESQFKREKE